MDYEKYLDSARVIVEDALNIQPDEKVMILTDTAVENYTGMAEIRHALMEVMKEKGIDPVMLTFQVREKNDADLPKLAEILCQQADVVISINKSVFIHSGSFLRAFHFDEGCRLMCLPSGNTTGQSDYIYRMLPHSSQEFAEIRDLSNRVGEKFMNGIHNVHVTADNGTDITFQVGTLRILIHDSVVQRPGYFNLMPGGSIVMGVVEGSANGTLVIDNCTALRQGLMEDRIVFDVKDGYAVSVTGGESADYFIERANANEGTQAQKFNIAEYGLGFNRSAQLNGKAGEGEHVYGASHFGIGSNNVFGGSVFIPAWHIDCILPDAKVEVDGEVIVENNEYFV